VQKVACQLLGRTGAPCTGARDEMMGWWRQHPRTVAPSPASAGTRAAARRRRRLRSSLPPAHARRPRPAPHPLHRPTARRARPGSVAWSTPSSCSAGRCATTRCKLVVIPGTEPQSTSPLCEYGTFVARSRGFTSCQKKKGDLRSGVSRPRMQRACLWPLSRRNTAATIATRTS
jgi:hypothetical protein